jgi:hypothetical protein
MPAIAAAEHAFACLGGAPAFVDGDKEVPAARGGS